LGDTPCVLLIDELNNLNQSKDLSEFLRDVFLKSFHRYFVFSSHEVITTGKLVDFMANYSNRDVLIRPLPLAERLGCFCFPIFVFLTLYYFCQCVTINCGVWLF